ncbi:MULTISPECIES: DUF4197 domain-containing protein [unclassified Duganella]|uniref:DUF4197 domain-containing protein n=1 Tax=unclassified Duganella TaxID=2636909 RepID=UPI0006F41B11|nr:MULTISPECIES: DUF4197 domain-containing protein [unclassified Duganella]KQV47675.1 hypothetical protein ASD07_12140 [Duganella sp. Root336D2]KRB82038.1 hypothetical protein ASE26_14135 [Duganella sp. Root198D2]
MSITKQVTTLLAGMALAATAFANPLDALTEKEAGGGLKAALEAGSVAAVGKLGVDGGFLNNDAVRIKLPRVLEKARPILEMTGRGEQLDELETAMNRAAEQAVPLAKPLLVNAVKSMTLSDAKAILTGGDTSVTDFFKEKTAAPLAVKFKPIVKGVTDKSKLSGQFNSAMAQATKFGLATEEQASVESYVTQRALDGLFLMIGEEEKKIRENPISYGSKAISKVFGLLK